MNIKWLGDFRDPWTDFFNYHESSRTKLAKELDKQFEKNILRQVDHLITVSPSIERLLTKKMNQSKNITTIMNGYDESDFAEIENEHFSKNINISYVGNISKSQNPIKFLSLVQKLNQEKKQNMVVNFVGNIHSDILEEIESLGYSNFINIVSYVSHSEAIKYMIESDYLLLLIPNVPNNEGIVTGKIFEYIRSGSTILMLGPIASDAGDIVKLSKSGFVFEYENFGDLESILLEKRRRHIKDNSKFSRERATEKLAKVFNGMINHVS
jgi:hypothetical protein